MMLQEGADKDTWKRPKLKFPANFSFLLSKSHDTKYSMELMSRHSSVSKVSDNGLNDHAIGVQSPAEDSFSNLCV